MRRRGLRLKAAPGAPFHSGGAVAVQIEQAFDGIEDLGAAAAAHPAFRHLKLVLDHAEHGAAGRAARDQAHARLPVSARVALAGHQDPAVLAVADLQRQPRRIGRLQFIRLAFQDAGEHQLPAGARCSISSGASSFSGVARMFASTTS